MALNLVDKRIRVLTIHKAKGLEAVLSVMIGNSEAGEVHKFRNRVYALSNIHVAGYSYDLAMADEAQRLVYVGLTRGKLASYWFVDEPRGAAETFGPWPVA